MHGTHFANRHSMDALKMSSFIWIDMLMKLVSNNLRIHGKVRQGGLLQYVSAESHWGFGSWKGGFKFELNWKNSEEWALGASRTPSSFFFFLVSDDGKLCVKWCEMYFLHFALYFRYTQWASSWRKLRPVLPICNKNVGCTLKCKVSVSRLVCHSRLF